ncbi:hypothetical protein SAMN05421720_10127 [Rhodospira trueperi]|uniref:Uncharacterized protein n=1 Tax=Rhodospira trueperi TaxID=69960 RepID=A0A1G6W6F9_9PROT|nr:hypothetical protein SAMN05421720_10127 [Rhodospira trueperi]
MRFGPSHIDIRARRGLMWIFARDLDPLAGPAYVVNDRHRWR